MKIDDSTDIIKVVMININTGEEFELVEKPDSKCHFLEPFSFGDYRIQLRIDWSDIQHGDPVLDADIWTESNNKKIKVKNEKWHHSFKEVDRSINQSVYIFKFENLQLCLTTRKTIGKMITSTSHITDSVEMKKNGIPILNNQKKAL